MLLIVVVRFGHVEVHFRHGATYNRGGLRRACEVENKMAAGGNVEVVWSNLMSYLSPESSQVLGITYV